MSLSVGYNQPAAAWGKKMTSDSGDLDFPTVDLPKDAKSCESIVHFLIGELVRNCRIRPEYSKSVRHQILKCESLGLPPSVGRWQSRTLKVVWLKPWLELLGGVRSLLIGLDYPTINR